MAIMKLVLENYRRNGKFRFPYFVKKWGMSMSDVKNVLAMVLGCGFIIVFYILFIDISDD